MSISQLQALKAQRDRMKAEAKDATHSVPLLIETLRKNFGDGKIPTNKRLEEYTVAVLQGQQQVLEYIELLIKLQEN